MAVGAAPRARTGEPHRPPAQRWVGQRPGAMCPPRSPGFTYSLQQPKRPQRHLRAGRAHLEEVQVPGQQPHFSLHMNRHQRGALNALHARAGACPPIHLFLQAPRARQAMGLTLPPRLSPTQHPGRRAGVGLQPPPGPIPASAGPKGKRGAAPAPLPAPEASFLGWASPAPRARGCRTGSPGWTGG